MSDIQHKPFRYCITVQWSDRHEQYVAFAGKLLSSAKMFAPNMDIIGMGNSPGQALVAGLEKSIEFIKYLEQLAILPPREEIAVTSESVCQAALTAQPRKVSNGSHR